MDRQRETSDEGCVNRCVQGPRLAQIDGRIAWKELIESTVDDPTWTDSEDAQVGLHSDLCHVSPDEAVVRQ